MDSTSINEEKSIKVEFKIKKKGGEQIKTLTYFDCDISNKGFLKEIKFKVS